MAVVVAVVVVVVVVVSRWPVCSRTSNLTIVVGEEWVLIWVSKEEWVLKWVSKVEWNGVEWGRQACDASCYPISELCELVLQPNNQVKPMYFQLLQYRH